MHEKPRRPSLELLRLFEVAARHGSFTLAASELGISQPAISQQVQRLEKQLGVRLFDRIHRGLTLTEDGRLLLGHVQSAMALLDEGLELLSANAAHETLNVATDFAFATYRLIPTLHLFHAANPGINVNLVTGYRGMKGIETDIDVAVAFGDGQVKNGESRLLFNEEVFPVCSPALRQSLQGESTSQALARLPLLHLKAASGHQWCDWPQLFRALGIREAPASGLSSFDNYPLLIQASIAGQGVAIGWRYLVDDLLDKGLLVRLGEHNHVTSFGYYIVRPERKRRSRLAQRFIDWLEGVDKVGQDTG
ncbi:choline sulfate utilization transcriptional regulator [Stutzerimonas kirkiae]|uniref:choline sulfate utilization transcriptional regulator n=1 Tax=Stutzerimonas kirkiae TaxID=2211392 RepID=UPI00103834C9|nr:LysR substrate-binding domain-containing protein [Stutzerimonas kirkiae]TBV08049.1 LysR family transcriptional regulator [Stutzerimonas kirkiae]